jgi:hypothetical protein
MTKVTRSHKSNIVLPVLLRFTASVCLGHCIACASEIYGFCFPWSLYCLCFWDLQLLFPLVNVLPVVLRFTASGYLGHCIAFWDLRLLVTLIIVLPVLLRFTTSGYLGHCIACSSKIYGFCLPWSLYCLRTGNTMTKVTRSRKSQKAIQWPR